MTTQSDTKDSFALIPDPASLVYNQNRVAGPEKAKLLVPSGNTKTLLQKTFNLGEIVRCGVGKEQHLKQSCRRPR